MRPFLIIFGLSLILVPLFYVGGGLITGYAVLYGPDDSPSLLGTFCMLLGVMMLALGFSKGDLLQKRLGEMEKANPSMSMKGIKHEKPGLIEKIKDWYWGHKTQIEPRHDDSHIHKPNYQDNPMDTQRGRGMLSMRKEKEKKKQEEEEAANQVFTRAMEAYRKVYSHIKSGAGGKDVSEAPIDIKHKSLIDVLEESAQKSGRPFNRKRYWDTFQKLLDRVDFWDEQARYRLEKINEYIRSNSERVNFVELVRMAYFHLKCLDYSKAGGSQPWERYELENGVKIPPEDPREGLGYHPELSELMTKLLQTYKESAKTAELPEPVLDGENSRAVVLGISRGDKDRRVILHSTQLEDLLREKGKNICDMDYTDFFQVYFESMEKSEKPMLSACYVGPNQIRRAGSRSPFFHPIGIILGGKGRIYDATVDDLHSIVDPVTGAKIAKYASYNEESKGAEDISIDRRVAEVMNEFLPDGHNELIVGGNYEPRGLYYDDHILSAGDPKTSLKIKHEIVGYLKELSKRYSLPLYSLDGENGFVLVEEEAKPKAKQTHVKPKTRKHYTRAAT